MTINELINALKGLKVQTGSLACLGCGHEHNCGIHGCAIIREAVARVASIQKAFNENALMKLAAEYLGVEPVRLRELVVADKAALLMVLPVRPVLTQSIGSMLYIIEDGEIIEDRELVALSVQQRDFIDQIDDLTEAADFLCRLVLELAPDLAPDARNAAKLKVPPAVFEALLRVAKDGDADA